MAKDAPRDKRKLSLYPLKFNDVIGDVLKVKPQPRTPKKAKKTAKRKEA